MTADQYFLPFVFSTAGSLPFIFVSIFCFFLAPGGLAWALYKSRFSTQTRTAIPGPSGLPILGMVLAFTGSLTHRVLAKLAVSFRGKPLMAFSVGFTRFVISSHPDTAKEILNSSAFADRPVKESAYELLFHRAIGFAPFGEYWRNLRRISGTHLFSPKRMSVLGKFRETVGLKMVKEIRVLMEKNGAVEMRKVLHFGSLNSVMMSVFGRSYEFGEKCNYHDDDGSHELEGLVREGYELLGTFNWSDHFPVLSWFDLQGVRKRCRKLVGKVNSFVSKIIEEHKVKRINKNINGGCCDVDEGDFVDVLLGLDGENRLTDSDMIAVLWVCFIKFTGALFLFFTKTKVFLLMLCRCFLFSFWVFKEVGNLNISSFPLDRQTLTFILLSCLIPCF